MRDASCCCHPLTGVLCLRSVVCPSGLPMLLTLSPVPVPAPALSTSPLARRCSVRRIRHCLLLCARSLLGQNGRGLERCQNIAAQLKIFIVAP